MSETKTETNVSLTAGVEPSSYGCNAIESQTAPSDAKKNKWWHREEYSGALIFNSIAFLLPALYATLSKLWIANIDLSLLATSDTYAYIGSIAGTMNSGLPKAAYLIIGDISSRSKDEGFSLAYTVILFQSILGVVMSVAFLGAANTFVNGFVPAKVHETSLKYVRISSFSALAVSIETSVSSATRALDKPDVPLFISTIKVLINIVLDLLVISWFHVGSHDPTVNDQAWIRLTCDLTAAFAGFVYFFCGNSLRTPWKNISPSWSALKVLIRPSVFLFIESAVRNGLYLWLVSVVVAMGSEYATAWSIFTTLRLNLIMVPAKALNTTTLAFVGHNWGSWRKKVGIDKTSPKATSSQMESILKPACYSIAWALAIEVPICIFFSYFGAQAFAFWVDGGSNAIADIMARMWRTIDWCYIFSAVEVQLSAILQATQPPLFLYQSLVSCLLYTLPWAVVCQVADLDKSNAWTYQSIAFGGALVFGCLSSLIFVVWWRWKLLRGTLTLEPFMNVTVG